MDLKKIVEELKKERDRISRVITVLEESESPKSRPGVSAATATVKAAGERPVNRLTPERRRRISQTMKKRWAEKRKKASSA